MFIGLLTSADKVSNGTERVCLSNQKPMTQPTLVNLHADE